MFEANVNGVFDIPENDTSVASGRGVRARGEVGCRARPGDPADWDRKNRLATRFGKKASGDSAIRKTIVIRIRQKKLICIEVCWHFNSNNHISRQH